MSTLTPNMNLIQPTAGIDTGLTWENAINANSSIVDGHSHLSGFGVPIVSAAININGPLPFNNFQATNLQSTTYTAQSSLATLLAVYCIGNDLYFNDGAGNAVRLTSGGAVNATASGIASGSATASFSSGVLVVNAASNTPANIQAGSILIGNNVSASKFLTLAPPSSMAANFQLTLPSIPGATSFLQIDTSGNISGATAVSGGITGSMIASATVAGSNLINNTVTATQMANGAIGTTQLANLGVTAAKMANATITGTQVASNINLPGTNILLGGFSAAAAGFLAGSQVTMVFGNTHADGTFAFGGGFSAGAAGNVLTITFTNAFLQQPTVIVFPTTTANIGSLYALNSDGSASQILIKGFQGGDYSCAFLIIGFHA